ncbi:MAG: acyl-CoA dehydrogenase family protein [Deltaproteobacteria bacterium]|nr:MAG: acyl-CoA dehydrogenase family protein [Deltaproteobacteria bacterium]
MNARFGDAEEAFRDEVRRFLEAHRDLDGFFVQDSRWDAVKAFFRALGERGWLSLAWPEAVGGLGRSPIHEYILWDECAYARAARPPLGAGVVAKTLIRYGSAAQKARWLPGIRSGELHFSLGYSEPEAGSDLASVRTRAERHGDTYRVSGEKCWTSYARHSDYLWCLCRTGEPGSRGRGLSILIVDLHAPGVKVGLLPTLDGEALHEVLLDDVSVPVEQRVGPENGAWTLMAEALADERHVQFPPARLRRDLDDVVAWARRHGLERDPRVRRTLADLAVGVREAEVLGLRVLETLVKGRSGVVEAAANKVFQTLLCQKIARAALDFGAPESLVAGNPVEFLWRQSMWETIGGGTSEIMLGVVAKQELRLAGRS